MACKNGIFSKVSILLLTMLFLTGCPGEDKTYITAQEQYAVGWILHNIDDSTQTRLGYEKKDFAVYNYSFSYPSSQPEYFADLIWWLPPAHKLGDELAAASHIKLSIPLDRVYYVKGENPVPENYGTEFTSSEWSFSKSIFLNYLKSDSASEQSGFNAEQFGLDVNHAEHYLSEHPYKGITPIPGDKRHIYFGTAPFTPASFIVENNNIKLNGNLMRGYNNNSYLIHPKNATVFSAGGVKSILLPMPEYKIYHDGMLEEEGELTDFDYKTLNYFMLKNGKYIVNITIPTDYPVWDTTIITAEITVPAKESQPPELQHIEVPPFFEEEKEIPIIVDLHDESGIKSVDIFASSGEDWKKLDVNLTDAENEIYGAKYTPSKNQEKINLRFTASDTLGNIVTYTILPAALQSRTVKFNLAADKGGAAAAKGDIVEFSGRCQISENEFCNNFLLKYYLNNESIVTDSTSYKVTGNNDYNTSAGGDFKFKWQVPLDFKQKEANFKVKYYGTGLYLPHEETVAVPIEIFDYDLGIFDLRINGIMISDYSAIKIKAGEQLNISATIRNLGQNNANNSLILFKVNGEAIDKKQISEIAAGEESVVKFEWVPKTKGYYTIEPEIEYKDDASSNNNNLSKTVNIDFIGSDAYAIVNSPDTATAGKSINASISAYNVGVETAENITARLYGFYKPENFYLSYSANAEEGEAKIATYSWGVDYNGTRYEFSASYNVTNVIVNISTGGFSEALSFSPGEKIKKMSNGIYLFMNYFSSHYTSIYIGNASETEKSIGSVMPYEQKNDNINWSAINTGKYMLALFLDAKDDIDFGNNYDYRFIDVVNEGINVKAKIAIDYNRKYFVGNKSTIEAVISNDGTEEAKNTLVTLFEQKYVIKTSDTKPYIKNFIIGSSKIDSLKAQDSVKLSFNWTPSHPDWNDLLLIAESKNDIYPADNDATGSAYVTPKGSDLFGYLFYPSENIFVNKSTLIKGSVYNAGKEVSSNISVALYELKGNGKDFSGGIENSRRLVENKSIGSLKPDSYSEIAFNWTPFSSGPVYLELVIEADNDGNRENNKNSLHLDVNTPNIDVGVSILSYGKFIIENKSTFVNVLLRNLGNASGEFNLSLRANGTVVDSIIIKGLSQKETGFFSFNWKPSKEGIYEIEAVADLSDADGSNNIDKDIVNVYMRKEINLSFVDKNGNYAKRGVILGDAQGFINGKSTFVVPDTPLEMWITDEMEANINNGFAASVYQNTSIGDSVIASSHIKKPVFQDGLILYEIFANNDTWDYGHFSAILSSELQELNIRYTELKAFVCNDYDFGSDECGSWKEIPSETLVSRGRFIVYTNANKAQAFAIGEKDYDGDKSADWEDTDNDNDGIPDASDSFTCHEGRLKSGKVNITENQTKVSLRDGTRQIADFNANTEKDRIDCREILAEKQPNITKRGYTLLSGVLLANETKILYVDKIASLGRVCIKDEEVDSINEVSQKCDGNNEHMVQCDGKSYGNYTCTDIGQQYKVEGLRHSAVTEPAVCRELWACAEWGGCSGGTQIRSCTDSNSCGTSFNKPNEEQPCQGSSGGSSGSSVNGRSGARSRYFTYQIGDIKDWHDGKTQAFALELYDLVSFDFGKRFNSMVLDWTQGTSIRITPSFKNEIINIKLGESRNFDLDYDGKDDISLTYDSSLKNKVNLILSRINPNFAENIINARIQKNETPIQAEKPRKIEKPPTTEKSQEKRVPNTEVSNINKAASIKTGLSALTIITPIAIAVLLVTLFLVFNASKRHTQYRQLSLEGGTGNLKNLESYIRMEIDKGFNKETISKALKNSGWREKDIDDAMNKIKD